jgi:hypothetical protein
MGFQSPNPLTLTGHIHPTIIHDPQLPPSNIIKSGVAFSIHIDWGIDGTAVPLMAGDFHVKAFFESYGGGPEPSFPPVGSVDVPVTSAPLVGNSRHYTSHIPVPGTLPVGAYAMVVLITYTGPSGTAGPLAASSDEVLVQIFP